MNLKNSAVSLILEAESAKELEEIKLSYLGRSGKLTLALKEITKLSVEDRPRIGRVANEVKTIIEDAIDEQSAKFKSAHSEKIKSTIDVTDPGIRPSLGHLHPVTQGIEEITKIFQQIGFKRVRYPEIDWDWYAFEALNFPDNHPARDDWETFFIDQPADSKLGSVLLTPHTSNGQIREMERKLAKQVELARERSETGVELAKQLVNGAKFEVKMLNIAKTYRRQSDASHTPMFHQFETLVVGEDISIAHLKGVLEYFVRSFFGENRKSRIRPYHFQFTEPSFETDVSCGVCNGTGMVKGEKCKLCKEGWLELGGAGMVHPNVLRNCGIDPKKYTGFASGWGVERVLMMKEGMEIDDLRMLYGNNLEFLEQF